MQPLRKDPILRRINICAHFNGIQHDTCRAGVLYASVKEAKTETQPYRFACFQDEAQGLVCEKAHWKTREEAEAEEAESKAMWARVSLASTVAHDDARQKGYRKGSSGVGSIPCPVCQKGHLHYSVAAYNGHMHAKCDTEGCVSWME